MSQRYSQKMSLALAMCLVGVFLVSDAERLEVSSTRREAQGESSSVVAYKADARSKACNCNADALKDLEDWKPYFKKVEMNITKGETHGIDGLPLLDKMDCILPALGIKGFYEGSAMMKWNEAHREQAIKAEASVILSVNGVGMNAFPPGKCGAEAMIQQFANDCTSAKNNPDVCLCNKEPFCTLTLTVFEIPKLGTVGLEKAHMAISHMKNGIKHIFDFWDPDTHKMSTDLLLSRTLEAKLLYIFDPSVRSQIRKAQKADPFNLWTQKHISSAVVVNGLEHSITNVTVFHKFSDHYKNVGFWPTIAANAKSATSVDLVFKEGFFEYGLDWWLVTWKHNGKLYATVPNNGGRFRDELEPWVSKILCTIGSSVAGLAGYLVGYVISDLFTNNERVEGFKGHTLTAEDADEELDFTILMKPDGTTKVRFSSSAWTSTTNAKVIDNDVDNNVRGLLELAEWVLAHPREDVPPADMFVDHLPEKLKPILKPVFQDVINTPKYHQKVLQLKWFAKNLIIAIQKLSIHITGADPNQYAVEWSPLQRS